MFPRVTGVKYLHDYVLELTFSDGSRGQVDLRERIEKANPAGVFAPLRDPPCFAQVQLTLYLRRIKGLRLNSAILPALDLIRKDFIPA